MPKTNGITEQALRRVTASLLQKTFKPWTPNRQESALLKAAAGLRLVTEAARDLIEAEQASK